mmetsp:Transcript_27591/g.58629  ORF Transcript_27591/g.58629 Transcript_27591/m.58629 type:complete len:255 (-) Transcript_27591:3007-3771(-)
MVLRLLVGTSLAATGPGSTQPRQLALEELNPLDLPLVQVWHHLSLQRRFQRHVPRRERVERLPLLQYPPVGERAPRVGADARANRFQATQFVTESIARLVALVHLLEVPLDLGRVGRKGVADLILELVYLSKVRQKWQNILYRQDVWPAVLQHHDHSRHNVLPIPGRCPSVRGCVPRDHEPKPLCLILVMALSRQLPRQRWVDLQRKFNSLLPHPETHVKLHRRSEVAPRAQDGAKRIGLVQRRFPFVISLLEQ